MTQLPMNSDVLTQGEDAAIDAVQAAIALAWQIYQCNIDLPFDLQALNVLYRFSDWEHIGDLDDHTRALFVYWKSNQIPREQRSLLLPEDGGTSGRPAEALLLPQVTASCHTDDHRVVIEKFDATLWFATADDEDIERLRDSEWGHDYIADSVAEDAAEYDGKVKEMFTYLDIVNDQRRGGDPIGFEVEVSADEAMAWVKEHRPHLYSRWMLEEEGDEEEGH